MSKNDMSLRPYKRAYTKRRYIPRAPRSRYSTYSAAGSQLWKDVMYLKSIVNVELKAFSTYINPAPIDAAGSVFHLSAVSIGDSYNNRDGDSILPKYMNIHIDFKKSFDALATATECIRVIIFRWKDQSSPGVTNILDNNVTTNYLSHYQRTSKGHNRDDRTMYLLMDKQFCLNKTDMPQVDIKKNFKFNVPKPGILQDHIKFNDTSTSAPMNGIYILAIAETPQASGSALKITMEVNNLLRFTDN